MNHPLKNFHIQNEYTQKEIVNVNFITAMFVGLGFSGVCPTFHLIATEGIVHNWFTWAIAAFLSYLMGAIIYGMRVPERLYPGKFDIVVSILVNKLR